MEGGWRLHYEDIKSSLGKLFRDKDQILITELEKQLVSKLDDPLISFLVKVKE